MSSRSRTGALPQRAQELDARLDVLEDVREHRHVDRLVRRVARLRRPARTSHAGWAKRSRANSSIHGLASTATTSRRHALRGRSASSPLPQPTSSTRSPSSDALDEEVVVPRQPMLRVHAAVVVDRAEVDSRVRIVVDLQQLAHRRSSIRLRANRAEPEPEERPPHGVGEQDADGRNGTRRPIPPATRRERPGLLASRAVAEQPAAQRREMKARACARSPRASARHGAAHRAHEHPADRRQG